MLLDWERTQSAKLPLTINTLAIDLANGWESICRVVQGTGSTDIEFRILMLSADEALLPDDAPPEVRRWARAAGDNLELLRDGLAAYRGPKVIAVRVRAYSAVPTIHGVLARKGNSRRLAVSECRWMGGPIRHYTFGEGEYLLIDPDQCSAMEDERAVGYTERFQHLYDTGRPILSRNYPV